MANTSTYIIRNTAGKAISSIQPNTLDGPGGVQQNSDLLMYGVGFPNWGEGVDQNDYHIVENFACPPLSSYPASARYALLGPIISAVTPAGEAIDELNGTGYGINVPLVGQLWYNTVNNTLYICTNNTTPATWTTVGNEAVTISNTIPGYTFPGMLWANTSVPYPNVTLPQLMIYNGSTFVSVAQNYLRLAGGTLSGALNMGGNQINNLADPTNPQDAVTVHYLGTVSASYLPLSGGNLTGTLSISSAGGLTMAGSSVNVISGGNISVTGGGNITVSGNSIAMNANGRITNVVVGSLTDALTATAADTRYLQLAGTDPMSGPINMGSQQITNMADPLSAQDAVTVAYLENNALPTYTFGPSGSVQLPGGFKMIWGQIGGSFGEGTYGPYPFAAGGFLTACVYVGIQLGSLGQTYPTPPGNVLAAGNGFINSNTHFTMSTTPGSAYPVTGFNYFAIGY